MKQIDRLAIVNLFSLLVLLHTVITSDYGEALDVLSVVLSFIVIIAIFLLSVSILRS